METVIITRRICLEPQFLTTDIHNQLFIKLKELTHNECTKQHGYIMSIEKILNIDNDYISRGNSDLVFIIRFNAHIFKPVEGMQLDGNVCMIVPSGIFVNILTRLK